MKVDHVRPAERLFAKLKRDKAVDMLHESPATCAEMQRLLEEEARVEWRRLLSEGRMAS